MRAFLYRRFEVPARADLRAGSAAAAATLFGFSVDMAGWLICLEKKVEKIKVREKVVGT